MSRQSKWDLHAIPASAGHDQVWDVFISHRGADKLTKTDIKKTFVSFLHARLQQAGIRSFMDEDSLKPGDEAWKTMMQAVRQCSIAIPVLSESYGNSVWCLRELTAMVETKRHVMPLFLDDSGPEVIKKIKAGSHKLACQAKPGELEEWQEAVELAGSPTGWRQDQMSGCVAIMTCLCPSSSMNIPANHTHEERT